MFIKEIKAGCSAVDLKVMSMVEVCKIFGFTEPPTLSTLLERVMEEHVNGEVRIIIDEYDGEELNEVEAGKIKSCLGLFTNLSIVILVQPLEKHREYKDSQEVNAIKHSNYQFINTGIQILPTLNKVMRTTKEVYNVLKIAQNVIECRPNILRHPNKEMDATSTHASDTVEINEAAELDGTVDTKMPNKDNNDVSRNVTEVDVAVQKIDITDSQHYNLSPDVLQQIEVDVNSEEAATTIETDIYVGLGLDYIHSEGTSNSPETVTNCIFPKAKSLGHNISDNAGQLPIFYYLSNVKANQVAISEILAAALVINEVLEEVKNDSPITLLCNIDNLGFIYKVMSVLTNNTFHDCRESLNLSMGTRKIVWYTSFMDNPTTLPTVAEKTDCFTQIDKEILLVTDIRGIRGMEFSNLVMLINPSQHYGRQYVAECIARCTSSKLFIISSNQALTDNSIDSTFPTLQEVIVAWKSFEEPLIEFKTVSHQFNDVSLELLDKWNAEIDKVVLDVPGYDSFNQSPIWERYMFIYYSVQRLKFSCLILLEMQCLWCISSRFEVDRFSSEKAIEY